MPEQISMQALKGLGVLQRRAVAQPAIERLLQERAFVQLGEHFGDGVAGDLPGDAERFDLTDHARAAAVLEPYFGPRTRQGRAPIVERALPAEPRKRGVDVVLVELALEEPGAELRFRELAPRKKRQRRDVRAVGVIGHDSIVRNPIG